MDRCADFARVVTAVSGSATIANVLANTGWVVHVAAVTALASAFDLALSPGRLARQHRDLARDFIQLERNALSAHDDQELRRIQERRLSIEEREPPHYQVLNLICHNDLIRAYGHPDSEYAKIGWLQRLLANVIDLRQHRIR